MMDHDPLDVTCSLPVDRRAVPAAAASAAVQARHDELFGRLLVHHGFADQAALDRAKQQQQQQRTDSAQPLAEVLIQSGVISAKMERAIELIVEEHLAKHDEQSPQNSPLPWELPTVSLAQATTGHPLVLAGSRAAAPPIRSHFGGYELLEEIARGGMGVVYKARQIKLNRLVALKMILSGELSSADQIQRFYVEAEAAATLDHPGIVPVYEVGQVDGKHYFSMALVTGQSLHERVKSDGPLPPQQAARLLLTAAEAVQYAHDQGIVHRDLKPRNILLDEQGQPRVTDFGLAKRMQTASELTVTGQIMGTPSYMPPEQAAGRLDEVGPISDVYSLGATLYFLLTGRPPFQTASLEQTIRQVIEAEPVPLRRLDPTIPRDLETICLKCLRKEADKRYTSAADLAADLRRWLDGRPIMGRRVRRSERVWLWCKRRPAITGLVALLCVGAVAAALLVRERQNATHAAGLVDSIAKADVQEVPGLVSQLAPYRAWADPLVRQRFAAASDGSVEQLYLRMALLPADQDQVPPLLDELLGRDTRFLGAIRDSLQPYQVLVIDTLWQTLHDVAQPAERRFRAGLVLATYATTSSQWTPDDDDAFLVAQLVDANPEHQPRLREYLRPLDNRLLGELERTFAAPAETESHQLSAAYALADYAANHPLRLSRLLTVATPKQYEALYPLLANSKHAAATEFLAQLVRETPTDDLSLTDRISLGQRRAGAAITLLRQGQRELILDVLRVGADPESLNQFVYRCRTRGARAPELLDCVDRVAVARQSLSGAARKVEDRVLYGLLLALGDFPLEEIAAEIRQPLMDRLVGWYRLDPSSAIHGATGWLLRRWGHGEAATKVDQTPLSYDKTGEREWYTLEIRPRTGEASENLRGPLFFTFIVFPPGEYLLGSPETEVERRFHERLHRVKLTHPIAVCDRELTWGQHNPIDNRQWHAHMERQFGHPLNDDDPVFGRNWYDAVTYCRWLTAQARLGPSAQCYEDPGKLPKDSDGNPKYERAYLDRHGFRLPTEAEWEVVCRSGTQTAFSFGNDVELLKQYGWFLDTSNKWSKPVGTLRPNPRGLFDLHGNIFEWVHDLYAEYPEVDRSEDPSGSSQASVNRVNRGGGWNYEAVSCRSARRLTDQASFRISYLGFRLAQVPGAGIGTKN